VVSAVGADVLPFGSEALGCVTESESTHVPGVSSAENPWKLEDVLDWKGKAGVN